MARVVIIIGLLIGAQIHNALSSEIKLSVDWIPQVDTTIGMGNWDDTMNCGPTALVMVASYLRGFAAEKYQVKELDDWLLANSLISALNGYNLTKPDGTNQADLRAAASYYYGLWNTKYRSIADFSIDVIINAIVYSLQCNRPAIIVNRIEMKPDGALHFMVVTGFKDGNNDGQYNNDQYDLVYVNDPGQSNEFDFQDANGKVNKGGITSYPISQFRAVVRGALIFNPAYQLGEYSDGWHVEPNQCPSTFVPFSQPFVDCYLNSGGLERLKPTNPPGLGYPAGAVFMRNGFYTHDFIGGDIANISIVLNPHVYNMAHGYLGVCYPIQGQLRDYWIAYNPGAPVTNEYFKWKDGVKYSVQWFEPSDNSYVGITYNNNNGTFHTAAELGFPQENFNQHRDRNIGYESDGWGIGGAGEEPAPTYASPPVVTIIDPGTGYREVKTDKENYSPGEKVTVSWSGFESYSHIGVAVSIYRGNERHLVLLDERSRSNYSGSASVSAVV